MYALSLGIIRHLVRQKSYRLFCVNTSKNTISDDLDLVDLEEIDAAVPDHTRQGVSLAVKYIMEEKRKGSIQWENLTNKLIEDDIKNPTTKVFQACVRLEELQLGLSYYNYLLESGKKLSIVDLMFFSKLLQSNKSEIKKYEDLISKLYDDIKENLFKSAVIRRFALGVFLEVQSCFDDISTKFDITEDKVGYVSVIIKALEYNKPDVAFKYMNNPFFRPTNRFVKAYISYCIERAKEGKFSPELITRLIDLCEKQTLTFNAVDLQEHFESLIEVVKSLPNGYDWYLSECTINKQSDVCSKCGETLLSKPLSDKEFEALKSHFFDTSFLNKNIYLTTDEAELKNFLLFLQKAKPYDIVLDALNLIYKKKFIGVQVTHRYLNYFMQKGFSLLVVGRNHSKGVVMKALQSTNKKFKEKIQLFFTSNMSEDDLFILYAALHGGLGTYFITGDNCGNHLSHLNDDLKRIFLKWQMSHQYVTNDNLQLDPPSSHCGTPQLTLHKKNQKYIWHLSQQPDRGGRINRLYPLRWWCLSATKK